MLKPTFGAMRRGLFALALLLLASNSYAARLLYTNSAHDLDAGRLAALGHTYTTFSPDSAGWTTALSGGNGAFDAIIVGEGASGYSLSAGAVTAIRSYVSNGGRLIVIGDHNANIGFLNNALGVSGTVEYGCMYDDSVGGALLSPAAGTSFAGGPATLANASCTSALAKSSTPIAARHIYGDADTSLAFVLPSGSGVIGWLGWDFCCSENPQVVDDWYIALDNTIDYSVFTTCSAEGYTGGRLTLCRKICETPQTPTTLAGLIRLYNAAYRQPLTCPAAQR